MIRVFLTGATGVMGMAGLKALLDTEYNGAKLSVCVLARQSKKNRRKLAPFENKGVEVIWGDLLDDAAVGRGVDRADIVLHVGGMVSPLADWYPEKTLKVNVGAMRNVIKAAVAKQERGEDIKVVYIGSVSQYGFRPDGVHWGRVGDPLNVATFDMYALSKIESEKMLSESGLKWWVSLRQTGILYPDILKKGSDPISFHVPMKGCLEWVTQEDSGRLLAAVCNPDLPESFWKNYYNIGGGCSYRLTNYDFVKSTLLAVGCPPLSKVFDRNWFATKNFHGIWYEDSDRLEELLHYRGRTTYTEYMESMRKNLPSYFRLAPLAPAFLIKAAMRSVAMKKGLGPLRWIADNDKLRIAAAWGGEEEYRKICGWDELEQWHADSHARSLDHGYDESRRLEDLAIGEIRSAAAFRGGECLGDSYSGDPDEKMEWRCSEGHRFKLTVRSVLRGGHWCPDCLVRISEDPYELKRLGERSKYLHQISSCV